MNGVSGHDSALLRLYWVGDNLGETGPRTTQANEMNFVTNHAPGQGLLYLLTISPAPYRCYKAQVIKIRTSTTVRRSSSACSVTNCTLPIIYTSPVLQEWR